MVAASTGAGEKSKFGNSGTDITGSRSQKKWQGIDDAGMERHERAVRIGRKL